MNKLKIVLLGKTGDGRSSAGNTILGKELFHTGNPSTPVTRRCESKRNFINERKINVVDTPGFFDASLPEEVLNGEIVRCITECAPGPHAFLIVLRVGRYTEQEIEVVKKITALFGEDALRYAVVLFTHGNDLSENQTIQDFVEKNADLQELVDKCGGGVHVIDNKYWKQQQDGHRSNRVQVENLLNTIEEMVKNNGGHYTNEMLQMVDRSIKEELKKNRNEGSEKERAKQKVQAKLSVRLVGVVTGIVVGAFLGAVVGVFSVVTLTAQILGVPALARAVGLQAAGAAEVAKAAVGVVAVFAAVGAVTGGIIGYDAAEEAETMTEAMKQAASATVDIAKDVIDKVKTLFKLDTKDTALL